MLPAASTAIAEPPSSPLPPRKLEYEIRYRLVVSEAVSKAGTTLGVPGAAASRHATASNIMYPKQNRRLARGIRSPPRRVGEGHAAADHEWAADVIVGDCKAHLKCVSGHIATGDLSPHAAQLLVEDRAPESECVRPLPGEHDVLGVGARAHNECEVEIAVVTGDREVDPRIEIVVTHLGVERHVGVPASRVAADEVVCLAGQRLQSCDASLRIGSDEPHAQHVIRGCYNQFLLREEDRMTDATPEEPDTGIGLPLVRFERKRQTGIRPQCLGPGSAARTVDGSRANHDEPQSQ